MIVIADLSNDQLSALLVVLKCNRKALGYRLDDLETIHREL